MSAHKSALHIEPTLRESLGTGTAHYISGTFIKIIGVLTMSKKTPEERAEQYKEWQEYRENFPALPWKAWGSWFSWGSPVGLGLFLVETAIAVWIIAQVF